MRQRLGNLTHGAPHAVAGEDLALVGVVQARQLDVFTLDVAPHVQLGPVADGERADVLAHGVAAVVQVPQLGALVARVPLAELVTEAQDALLGTGLVLVTAAAAEDGVELVGLDGVQQRNGLQRVAGAVGALGQLAAVNELLDAADDELQAQPFDGAVAEVDDLGEVVAGVHVQHGERNLAGPERLGGQVQHDHGVLAAGEQQRRLLELGYNLADDVDRLRLERVQAGEARGGSDVGHLGGLLGYESAHTCSPHSVLLVPAQRPARGSSPGATLRVQGWQPMDG